jgi:DNA-binding MarR family transcriptional regulator
MAASWSVLGNADDVKKSDERRKIIAALRELGESSPKAIADHAGLKSSNVRNLVRKMVASGDINQPRVGFYSVPYSPQ